MYFYDLTFDDKKMVFSEYLMGQIVVLNDNFTIDITIFDEKYYGSLFWGVYTTKKEYIFSVYKSKTIKKYVIESESFVDVTIKDLPNESMVCFKHDEVFVQKDKIIIITSDNEILVSDLTFSEIKYVKSIYKGESHRQIVEDDKFLFIPIEKTIFSLSKSKLEINVYAQLDQTIDVLFRNKKGLWSLTNDAQLINLDAGDKTVNISEYIHFYANKESGQIYNYEKAYCYEEKVLLVPCYCDYLLLFDTLSSQITVLMIEKEQENDITLHRACRKNIQKYIASCQKGERVFFLSSSSELLYEFNFEAFLVSECLNGINGSSLIKIELEYNKILIEQPGGINLTNYIEYITSE